jgi:transcriptional regulator with XRE-family HTH domain
MMPSRATKPEREAHIIAQLLATRHALRVAREEGECYATVWRLAERESIDLAAGRDARGKRLSDERRAAVLEARRVNPDARQEQIARVASVSRATVSRIERGHCRSATGPKAG